MVIAANESHIRNADFSQHGFSVADSTIARDRDVKIPLYGMHGIPEAWLVDANRQAITVYRNPSPGGYGSALGITGGNPSPACLPQGGVDISALFGPS